MSTGNDNFITLDNIAEIQDIVNGDYMFTISNGVIYKLDFQNFIISKENTDFFTTIDTLSAQVVTNTQSLCSINAYINDTVKPNFGKLDSIYNTINSLSGNWNSTYTTINSLSTQAFLPISTDSNNIQAGSMVYYDGNNSRFVTLVPGGIGEILNIQSNGLPGFLDVAESNIGATVLTTGRQEITPNFTAGGEYNTTETFTVYSSNSNSYKNVRIATNVNIVEVIFSSQIAGASQKRIETQEVILSVNGTNIPTTNGVGVIELLNPSESIAITFKSKGIRSNRKNLQFNLNYSITGFEQVNS